MSDHSVEDDPEVVELKTALREAELPRQIEEISGPSTAESRLVELEEAVEALQVALAEVNKDRESLERRLINTPPFNLRERFKCECDSAGFLDVEITCTNCYFPKRYEWRPKKT